MELNEGWINEAKVIDTLDDVKVPTKEEIDKKVDLRVEGPMVGGLSHDAAQIVSMMNNQSVEEAYEKWEEMLSRMYKHISNGEYRKW